MGGLFPARAVEFVSPALGLVYFDVSNKRRRCIIFPIKVIKLDRTLNAPQMRSGSASELFLILYR